MSSERSSRKRTGGRGGSDDEHELEPHGAAAGGDDAGARATTPEHLRLRREAARMEEGWHGVFSSVATAFLGHSQRVN